MLIVSASTTLLGKLFHTLTTLKQNEYFLARSPKVAEGLYVLPSVISIFFSSFFSFYLF